MLAQSSDSGAVREYEAYRRWKDQGHKGDYEDFLEWQKNQQRRQTAPTDRRASADPPRSREYDRSDDDDDRAYDDDDDERRRRRRPNRIMIDRRPQPDPRIRPIGHDRCVNHYDDIVAFDGFPCRVVRPCKECGELVTLYARSYEYDKRGTLEDIYYRDTPCPRCNEKVELKISFRD